MPVLPSLRAARGGAPKGAEGSWASVEASVNFLPMQGLVDRFDDIVGTEQDVVIPEPQRAKATGSQRRISMPVMPRLIEMLTAIQLDDDPRLDADEIADIDADGMFPPELEASQLAAAQAAP